MKLKLFQRQAETAVSMPTIPNSGPLRRQISNLRETSLEISADHQIYRDVFCVLLRHAFIGVAFAQCPAPL